MTHMRQLLALFVHSMAINCCQRNVSISVLLSSRHHWWRGNRITQILGYVTNARNKYLCDKSIDWLLPGFGLFLVGRVCSRVPPEESSSRSLEFRHFMRRFWNHIFTWNAKKVYFNLWFIHKKFRKWKVSHRLVLVRNQTFE